MRDTYLTFGKPVFEKDEIDEVVDTIRSGWVGTGPKVQRLEAAFAEYLGVPHCVATSSCTAALHLSMLAAEIGPGDEVIVPALTFCATANAVIHAGATPVFADVVMPDMTLDPGAVEAHITPRTRAIVPVHLYGRPCRLDALREVCDRHDLFIIEDAAHAIETLYHGRHMGCHGHLATFSFYVTKNMTTVEGGMIATTNAEWADRFKVYALHGLSQDAWQRYSDAGYRHYRVVAPGFKYNMTDLQASFGLHQLRKLEGRMSIREKLWAHYDRELAGLPLILPPTPEPDTRHGRHLYALRVTPECPVDRDTLMMRLHERNIGTGVHYVSLSEHPYYQDAYGCRTGMFPNAESVGSTTLSLPLSAGMSIEDADDVVEAVRESVARG